MYIRYYRSLLSIYVYSAKKVNFAFRRKLKMTATCNFVSLGEKMHELLVKKMGKKRDKLFIT